MDNKTFNDLKKTFPNSRIYQNHPLAPYTTIKIGGPADIFIHSQNTQELVQILKYISKNKLQPLTLLGNGSNVLISDSGIRGIVIKNDSQEIETLDDNQIKVSSGTLLSTAIDFLAKNNLSGLEEFAYIPATVGGAIYSNIHGFNKNNFSKLLKSIEVFDLEKSILSQLDSEQLEWDYDKSEFQSKTNLIILSSIIELEQKDGQIVKKTAQKIIKEKTTNQLMKSAGCTFKNPIDQRAGQIIDQQLNLKAYSIGDAQVSSLHANFIINKGKATAKDYLKLTKLIQSQAKDKLNINLELEIKLLGKF